MTPRKTLLLSLLAVTAGWSLSVGCGGNSAGGPNVLLITVDTLRADRLHCYGYSRDTSPNLDALAEEGVRFARAYSHAPWTPPSHASLLTGLHVQSHGVVAWGQPIAPEARTLGQRLGERGWRTGAFYNHPTLELTEVTRGFDEVQKRIFEEYGPTVDAFLEWVDGGDEPFAAWVHLWDVHRPYGFRDWRPEHFRELVDREELTLAYEEQRFGQGDPRIGRSEDHYNLSAFRRARAPLSTEDFRFISDRYDGGVWYADQGLGLLFDALRERGVLDDTLVIVTADHGETLTEREECYFTHDPFLYEETLHVPLIVRFPGAEHAGRVVEELVRGVDVLPTILEVCDAPATYVQGFSLLERVVHGNERPWPLLAETRTKNPKEYGLPVGDDGKLVRPGPDQWYEHRRLVTDGRWKLIQDVSRGCWRLYDLEADPDETVNLFEVPVHRSQVNRLQELLVQLDNLLPDAGETQAILTPAQLRVLAEIGYLPSESGGDPESSPGGGATPLPVEAGSGCP